MDYKKMIEEAKSKGVTSEKIMWEGVDDVNGMLCVIKKEHPKAYWSFMRRQHGLLYGNHYSEEFALLDIEQMKPLGMYWTKEQVEEATKAMAFPSGTNIFDKWVAFNSTKNDLNGILNDGEIIKVAHAFWFQDKDWREGKSGTKIWEYYCCNYSK